MKLASYLRDDLLRVGAVHDDQVFDAGAAWHGPDGMLAFLEQGASALQALEAIVSGNQSPVPLREVTLRAPVRRPPKFFGISLNYLDHIEETGLERPEYPTVFNKQSTCVIGPDEAIERPNVSEKLDYEGELGIVIGNFCRHVSRDEAPGVIAGYTIVNDVSIRDWQMRSHTWTLGKSFDTHGPVGPWIVTPDEIGDPHKLDIRTFVNDEQRQSSNTDQLLFDCFYLVEYLSTVMTLEPGDIIATGTSSGVGVKMKPRGYMKPGDVVKVEIEKIGVLSNPVIQED